MAPLEEGPDSDTSGSSWSPEMRAGSYERHRRALRRLTVTVLAAYIGFEFTVALLTAGWIVAVSLATPQIIGLIMIYRQLRRPKPYPHSEEREDGAAGSTDA